VLRRREKRYHLIGLLHIPFNLLMSHSVIEFWRRVKRPLEKESEFYSKARKAGSGRSILWIWMKQMQPGEMSSLCVFKGFS
jgi:hypothetical protein